MNAREAGSGPRVLLVGPVTLDLFDEREAPGGAVTFAARVASAFGERAGVVTMAARGSDVTSLDAFAGHDVRVVETEETLTFRHHLDAAGGGVRQLEVVTQPQRMLHASDVPREWRAPMLVMMAPLLPQNLDVGSLLAPGAIGVGDDHDHHHAQRREHDHGDGDAHHDDHAGPGDDHDHHQAPEFALLAQGLLRSVDDHGMARHVDAPPVTLTRALDDHVTLFVSDEDVAPWPQGALAAVAARAGRLVITRGARGAEVRWGLSRYHVAPPHTAKVVDATGSGDVFAAAFSLALALGIAGGEEPAARLASVYAGANLEREGAAPLPPLDEALRRVEAVYGAPASGEARR